MKVGILTMNYRRNYGGILQCVALQHALEEMGHTVEVIRFQSLEKGSFRRKIKLLFAGLPVSVLGKYLYDIGKDFIALSLGKQKPLSAQLLSKCKRFVDTNIKYTELCNEETIGNLIARHQMDAVVIGSDKIWGELARNQLVYMGDFRPPFKGRIISYAACSSFPFIPSYNKEKIHRLLHNFSAISVRDTYTRNLFKCYPDIDMQIVLDPTFLYDFAPYLTNKTGESYVFTYILGREIEGGHKMMIEQIRKRFGNIRIKAFVLSDESMDIVPYVDEVIDDADPAEWLNAIHNASFVYTDSFHGIVFSLKFGKPFVGYYTEASRATRLIDLRDRLHLDRMIVSSVQDALQKESFANPIDYKSVNETLDDVRRQSLSFLNKALQS